MLDREEEGQTMNITLRLSCAGAIALAGLIPSAASAQTIVFNCFFPPQHYTCRQMLRDWSQEIEKATSGRVKFNIPPKTLAAPPDQYDGVVNGVMDGAIQFNQFISNNSSNPFVIVDEQDRALAAPAVEAIEIGFGEVGDLFGGG
jgi:TRAP-type C4-dicarboxylate transport system substrate-binding protein